MVYKKHPVHKILIYSDQDEKSRLKWLEQVDHSFLSDDFKTKYKTLIEERFIRLG